MLSDEALKAACFKAEEMALGEFISALSDLPEVTLKKKDHKRIRKFLKILDSGYVKDTAFNLQSTTKIYTVRRTLKSALVAAIILALLIVTGVAVKPIRNFFTEVTSDGTFFKFGVSNDNNDYLYASYSYIPEGYTLVSDKNMEQMQITEYKNNNMVIYINSAANSKGSNLFVNSENAIETGEVMVGGSVGYYCINEEDTTIVWATGKYHYLIMADNCNEITVETLVKIALSREKLS